MSDHDSYSGVLTTARIAELRAIATRNLAECCDECRALLREQLRSEEVQVGEGV